MFRIFSPLIVGVDLLTLPFLLQLSKDGFSHLDRRGLPTQIGGQKLTVGDHPLNRRLDPLPGRFLP